MPKVDFTALDPLDPHAQNADLLRALRQYKLDDVLAALSTRADFANTPQRRANLLHVFDRAQRDHIDLSSPPDDFHPWLLKVLAEQRNGRPALPTTVSTRLSLLKALYRELRALGVLTVRPLDDLTVPNPEPQRGPLPPRTEIDTLIAEARVRDPRVYVAILLMARHAFGTLELLRMRWGLYDPQEGTVLRKLTVSRLEKETNAALERLLRQRAGGRLYREGFEQVRVLAAVRKAGAGAEPEKPLDKEDDLRLAVMLACRAAGLKFISPSVLRRCAVRDYGQDADALGYGSPQAFAVARARAAEVGRKSARRRG